MEKNLIAQNNADIVELCQLKQTLAVALEMNHEENSMGHIALAIEKRRQTLLASDYRDTLAKYDCVRHRLINRNQRMAYYMMWRRVSKSRANSDDMGSDAVLGLIMGIDRFDAIRFPNLQLSTYVRFWVNQQVHKNGDRNVATIRSRGDIRQLAELCTYIEQRMHSEARQASIETIAEDLCLTPEYVRRLLHCYFASIEGSKMDFTEPAERSGNQPLENREQLEFIKSLLPTLPKQQRLVIDAVYFRHVPVGDLASQMNLSSSRIRQIQRSGIDRLRKAAENKMK